MRLFPQEEFEVRLGRVREKMIQEKIDYLVIPSNVENDFLYIAGYQPVYGEAVIVIPLGKEPLLFFNTEWDKERIENSTYVEDIRAVEDPVIGSCSYLKSFDADSIGVVGYWELPYRVFKNVESFLSGKVRDASICLREVRLRCSDWEIECYQKAVAIAEAGMLRAVEILKSLQEDISERELAQEIQIAMDREEFGGFSGVCVGSGQRSAQPVALPTDKVIHPGEFIVIDVGGAYREYCSDICRTFVVGEVAEPKKKLLKAVKDVLEILIKDIRPGVSTQWVQEKARELFAGQGFSSGFLHHVGHDLGFKPGELVNFKKDDMELGEGMVFALEPALYFHDQGGVRIENDVLLTASGPVSLNQLPLLFPELS